MEKVAIIGSGLIGQSWAMIFSGYNYNIYMYDVKPEQTMAAISSIRENLLAYQSKGYLRGNGSITDQMKKIHVCQTLEECIQGADYVQECIFEKLEVKKEIFERLEAFASDETILASSTSCILPSLISKDMVRRNQFVVAHPVNPPYLVPLVEIIPAKWTDENMLKKTRKIMTDVGQAPVVLKKEIPGFAVNRIQYNILNECWRLVQDGIMSAVDVDTVMHKGLGHRYAYIGPLETAHLNAHGMKEYCEKYASGIRSVSSTFGEIPSWDAKEETVNTIEKDMVPLDKLQERRLERDQFLVELAILKKKYNQ